MADVLKGYTGNLLRVDLTSNQTTVEKIPSELLPKYIGGAGLGAKYLYDELDPKVQWSDADNRIIIATGPLSATTLGGSGCFTVVSKGALTDGMVYAEANGFLGAFLKLCGYDMIIIQGAAEKLRYLYIAPDGSVEIRDAAALKNKDCSETERLIKQELGTGERQSSVFSIGPAGEKKVRFACLVGDRGHVAGHNGIGAVFGSKNLKAIAVSRGKIPVELHDVEKYNALTKKMYEKVTGAPGFTVHEWGTRGPKGGGPVRIKFGRLPIKNQTTNLWKGAVTFDEETARTQPNFKLKRNPCWACRYNHCHTMEIIDGPYKGLQGDFPEYEGWAAMLCLIGIDDWEAAAVLSNETDFLGIDCNESGWMIAWIMECYEKELLSTEDLDGLKMNWGNVASARELLRKIAFREGVGDILAEGVMRSAKHFGGYTQTMAVYTNKGNTPRMHDHRASWPMILDTVTSDRGRDGDGVQVILSPVQAGLPSDVDIFSAKGAAQVLAKLRGRFALPDSLVVCRLNVNSNVDDLAELLDAATGWNITGNDLMAFKKRVVNLCRLFNNKHGHSRELDYPSARYSSTPIDGANVGKGIGPVWDEALEHYYEIMGWDKKTGEPLPETLSTLGL